MHPRTRVVLCLLLQSFSILQAQDAKPLKIGDVSTGTLTYPALDNLDLREGTIECWVKFAFNPLDHLPAKDYFGMVTLLSFGTPRGGANVAFIVQAGQSNATWFSSMGPKPRIHGMYIGTPTSDLFGKWQHLALAWKNRETRAYLDGKLAGNVEHIVSPYQVWGALDLQPIFLGDRWSQRALMVLDDVRVSRIARAPEELGWAVGELKPDPYTTLLDPFEDDFVPDGKRETKPHVIANGSGGLPSAQCRFVPGKFGKGLAFYNEGEKK